MCVSHSAAPAGHGGSAPPAISAAVGSWELGRTQRVPNPSHASPATRQVEITLHVSIISQVARLERSVRAGWWVMLLPSFPLLWPNPLPTRPVHTHTLSLQAATIPFDTTKVRMQIRNNAVASGSMCSGSYCSAPSGWDCMSR